MWSRTATRLYFTRGLRQRLNFIDRQPDEHRQPGRAAREPMSVTEAPSASPRSCTELFLAFNRLALQGFGGVLAVAQVELVERRRWLTREEFVELLSVSQVLPGPNVVNLCADDRRPLLRLARRARRAGRHDAGAAGDRAGAARCCTPASPQLPAVAGALRGMGAVAAGLVVTALKLAGALRRNRWPAAVPGVRRRTFVGHRAAALAAGLGDLRPRALAVASGLAPDRTVMPMDERSARPTCSALFGHFTAAQPAGGGRCDHHRVRHAPLSWCCEQQLDHRRAVHRLGRDRTGRTGAERAVRGGDRLERRRAAGRAGHAGRHTAAVDGAGAVCGRAGRRSGARARACAPSPAAWHR